MRGSNINHNMADNVFNIVVVGNIVKIDVVKSRSGLLFNEDDPRLEPVREAILRYISEDIS